MTELRDSIQPDYKGSSSSRDPNLNYSLLRKVVESSPGKIFNIRYVTKISCRENSAQRRRLPGDFTDSVLSQVVMNL